MSAVTLCRSCETWTAVACDECRRALAMLDHPSGFAGIARHPEVGVDCRICEAGAAELCVDCLCREVLAARSSDVEAYHPVAPERFAADLERARADRERVERMRRESGIDVQSIFDPSPASVGPSWYRMLEGRR